MPEQTRMHRCDLATNPESGNKPAPNGGSELHFAMNKDENKLIINKGTASRSMFRAAHDLHFKAEETEASSFAH